MVKDKTLKVKLETKEKLDEVGNSLMSKHNWTDISYDLIINDLLNKNLNDDQKALLAMILQESITTPYWPIEEKNRIQELITKFDLE